MLVKFIALLKPDPNHTIWLFQCLPLGCHNDMNRKFVYIKTYKRRAKGLFECWIY